MFKVLILISLIFFVGCSTKTTDPEPIWNEEIYHVSSTTDTNTSSVVVVSSIQTFNSNTKSMDRATKESIGEKIDEVIEERNKEKKQFTEKVDKTETIIGKTLNVLGILIVYGVSILK